ncbi:2,3-diaminopropionate biosynthesis protein SbnB [Dickeya zeae]|uniref:2,3-diaminopropionate biosynthesis protein SbnB n=1 Tax=Dickeya zeae TaxID=204042 RepID=UPI00143FEB93|nr:2,3-diaminopropionate biosynthesis protein SbnB [Dickeya zeae]QIZ47732.1 2,3-diaminopropionate biosynthesis protein SbnB [Dickeya zeae]UUE08637.1 2,3-diaminopropionate biosynthesis protein SbnB [Dickeya zeae]
MKNDFYVITSADVHSWLSKNKKEISTIVKESYCLFHDGKITNPDSYFLRFPDSEKNRIIALPASINTDEGSCGIKWISSFPANLKDGLNRASAVIILNDRATGYPIACIEGSQISAIRTAASAVAGAEYLHDKKNHIDCLGIIGTGLISFHILEYFLNSGWSIKNILVNDTSHDKCSSFIDKCQSMTNIPVESATIANTITRSDMIVFATSAVVPHIHDHNLFSHNPTLLHISLRDLGENVILNADNYVDDHNHAVKAKTSLHITQEATGRTDFIKGNIADLIKGSVIPNYQRPRIYSPFGMGMLDIALATRILNEMKISSSLIIDNFHPIPLFD